MTSPALAFGAFTDAPLAGSRARIICRRPGDAADVHSLPARAAIHPLRRREVMPMPVSSMSMLVGRRQAVGCVHGGVAAIDLD